MRSLTGGSFVRFSFSYTNFHVYCNLQIHKEMAEITCKGCRLSQTDYISKLAFNEHELINFLSAHGVILKELKCPKCGSDLKLGKDFFWRCQKTRIFYKGKKKLKKKCNFKQSLRKNTFFEKSKWSIELICTYAMYYITINPPKYPFLLEEFNASPHSVVSWNSFLREVLLEWGFRNTTMEKLGGVGKTVEIGEAKMEKRKYNQSRIIEGQWVVGGVERNSKKIFIVDMPDRTHESLLSIILQKIEEGTKIISECWPSCSRLEEYGFIYETINPSKKFIDPQFGAHTENIEGNCGELRSNIPKAGRKKEHYAGYLAEYMFLRAYPNFRDRAHELFKAIGQLYNPSETPIVEAEAEMVCEDISPENEGVNEEEYEEIKINLLNI